jgi:hypothetical protein
MEDEMEDGGMEDEMEDEMEEMEGEMVDDEGTEDNGVVVPGCTHHQMHLYQVGGVSRRVSAPSISFCR